MAGGRKRDATASSRARTERVARSAIAGGQSVARQRDRGPHRAEQDSGQRAGIEGRSLDFGVRGNDGDEALFCAARALAVARATAAARQRSRKGATLT